MGFFWKKKKSTLPDESPKEPVDVVFESEVPSVETTSSDTWHLEAQKHSTVGKQFGDLIEEIIGEHSRNGGFESLEGRGKPLKFEEDIHEDYYLNKTLKEANVLPPWLELQHDIRNSIGNLIERVERGNTQDLNQRIAAINKQIARYNEQCPSPLLQKRKLTKETLHSQQSQWQ